LDGPAQHKSLLIEPRPGDLTDASGTVVTEFGPVTVSWKKAMDRWDYAADTSNLPHDIKTNLRLPIGLAKFTADLDDKALPAGGGGVVHPGRWLDVPLTPGKHRGFWKTDAE
jgi:hypothetical protein